MEKENIVPKPALSKTYKEVCNEWIIAVETPVDGATTILTEDQKNGALMLAEHLDGSNVMTNELTLMAIQAAREVDREFILLLIDVVGIDKAKELAQKVHDNHRHTGVKE